MLSACHRCLVLYNFDHTGQAHRQSRGSAQAYGVALVAPTVAAGVATARALFAAGEPDGADMVSADVTVDLPTAEQLVQLSKKALHFLMVREGWTPPRRPPINVVTGKFIEPGGQWNRERLVRELQLLRTARR